MILNRTNNFFLIVSTETNTLLKLGFPLVLSGLIESSPRFFYTLFFAHLNYYEFAAGAIVSWLFGTLMCVLWGILTAVSVLASHHHGAQNKEGVISVLRDGLVLALLLTVFAFFLLRNASSILLMLGQDPQIVQPADAYLHALSWSVLPNFIMLVLMQFIISLGHTHINLLFSLIFAPLNILSNYVFIFGKLGLPAFGIAGIGWGATFTYWVMVIALLLYMLLKPHYKTYLKAVTLIRSPSTLCELLRVGAPMGIMYSTEVAFFLVLNLLMGQHGIIVLAANQITLQYLGQFIAIIFSIAQAVSIRIGYKLGSKNLLSVPITAYIGMTIMAIFSSAIALFIWLNPLLLVSLDINIQDVKNTQIIHYATQFLTICALFQLCESTRMVLFGTLRGLKDTVFTLLSSIIGFWCIAIPIGYIFANQFGWGALGLWWGMIFGSASCTLLLFYRFRYKMQTLHLCAVQ